VPGGRGRDLAEKNKNLLWGAKKRSATGGIQEQFRLTVGFKSLSKNWGNSLVLGEPGGSKWGGKKKNSTEGLVTKLSLCTTLVNKRERGEATGSRRK